MIPLRSAPAGQLAAGVLERRPEQGGQHQRLGEDARDQRRIIVRRQHVVEQRPSRTSRPRALRAGGEKPTAASRLARDQSFTLLEAMAPM